MKTSIVLLAGLQLPVMLASAPCAVADEACSASVHCRIYEEQKEALNDPARYAQALNILVALAADDRVDECGNEGKVNVLALGLVVEQIEHQKSAAQRHVAISILARYAKKKIVADFLLSTATINPDPVVRRVAIQAMQSQPVDLTIEAIGALLPLVENDDEFVRRAAVQILSEFANPRIDKLRNLPAQIATAEAAFAKAKSDLEKAQATTPPLPQATIKAFEAALALATKTRDDLQTSFDGASTELKKFECLLSLVGRVPDLLVAEALDLMVVRIHEVFAGAPPLVAMPSGGGVADTPHVGGPVAASDIPMAGDLATAGNATASGDRAGVSATSAPTTVVEDDDTADWDDPADPGDSGLGDGGGAVGARGGGATNPSGALGAAGGAGASK